MGSAPMSGVTAGCIGVKVGLSLFLAVWALTEWGPDKGDEA
jgi:hypothetical protein